MPDFWSMPIAVRTTLSWSLPTCGSRGQRVEDLGLDEGEEHAREAADQELVAGLEVLAGLDRGAGGQAGEQLVARDGRDDAQVEGLVLAELVGVVDAAPRAADA
jgi:hypothetical protein